jgi:hypothetical protein
LDEVMLAKTETSRYSALIGRIFREKYKAGMTEVPFRRDDLTLAAKALRIELPKNLGDVIYSMRYRAPLPGAIKRTQPKGSEWVIEGIGRSEYAFRLVTTSRIVPNANLVAIKIPDSTPQIIAAYALTQEQAVLAKIRYNRLIDIFLGVTAYSLQNHLRTTVKGVGQIEIDEMYVAVNRAGAHFIIPVQAKGGNDKIGVIQTRQDYAYCVQQYPTLICRLIAAQSIKDDVIALFELTFAEDEIKVIDERHYKLVPRDHISAEELAQYRLHVQ